MSTIGRGLNSLRIGSRIKPIHQYPLSNHSIQSIDEKSRKTKEGMKLSNIDNRE
jgi:hypothetical protein